MPTRGKGKGKSRKAKSKGSKEGGHSNKGKNKVGFWPGASRRAQG